ncbi:MAG TPA: matrixin family metalloprotease [Terriglobia bacterium]|nr:matrixin family metalloprotease [Terriglobia bacterium]
MRAAGRRIHAWHLLTIALILASTAIFLFAYNHEQDNVSGTVVAEKWCNGNFNDGSPCTSSVSWSLNNPAPPNVDTTGGVTVQQAIQSSFASWQGASLNGQSIAKLTIMQGPNSSRTAPDVNDCVNVIGFADPTTSDFPTGTIAFTIPAVVFGPPPITYTCADTTSSTYTCPLPSCIVDADIEFNPNDTFSTADATPANDFDLQALATHEAGHLLGMDHSGLISSIMFAFGDAGGVPQRGLSVDDVLGIGSVYPSASFASAVGSLSGTVTLAGTGVFASHVIIIDAQTGSAVVDSLTDTNGKYQVNVPPGQYNVLALPLAGIYDISAFGGWACGYEENAPPCCDPTLNPQQCKGTSIAVPTDYSGKFN